MTNSYFSIIDYEYTGQSSFTAPSYLQTSDITVTVNGVAKVKDTDYTLTGTSVAFTGFTPSTGDKIRIQRSSGHDARRVDFNSGSMLKAETLDADSNQMFYMAQEAIDTAQTISGDYNAKYWGSLPNAPASPSVGDLWFDNTNNVMKVYNTQGWQVSTSAVTTSSQRVTYTVGTTSGSYDGSTSTFPVTYDAGFVDVYLNGVKQVLSSDFQAVDGSTVVLTPAASSGDIVDIVAYGETFLSSDIANKLDKSGGTLTGDVEFGANKAKFVGLEIYNTIGNTSVIEETGLGNLVIKGEDVRIQTPTNDDIIKGEADGAVTLYYDNDPKLATTNTGISVTGRTTTDTLTVSDTQTHSEPVDFGSSAQTGYTKVDFNDSSSDGGKYLISYGAAHSSQDKNFAMKNLVGDIFFEVKDGASNAEKLRVNSDGISVTGTITATGYNSSNWDTAYGWGNHASAGYLTGSNGISVTGVGTFTNDSECLKLQSATSGGTVRITFSDQSPIPHQKGYIDYCHFDGDSYGSGNAFKVTSTEPNLTFLVDGKLMYSEGIYTKPASGTGSGTRKDANWDTAYNNHITGVNYSGSTLTLTQQDGGTITTTINASGGGGGGGTATGVDLADNVVATFGDGNDLQIYHDGSNSYIKDSGAGNLRIAGQQVDILNPDANEFKARFLDNGAVELYYDNEEKLATTSTGIDVTGNVSLADNGKATFGASDDLQIYHYSSSTGSESRIEDTGEGLLTLRSQGTGIQFWDTANGGYMLNATVGGAVDLYHSNDKRLATTSTGIDVTGDIHLDNASYLRSETSSGGAVRMLGINASNVAYVGAIDSGATSTIFNASSTSNTASFYTAGSEKMRITSDGKVGIGTTTSSPPYLLTTNYNANANFTNAASDFTQMWQNSGTNGLGVALADDSTARLVTNNGYALAFNNATSEAMRIDSSGNVGIGTSIPSAPLSFGKAVYGDNTSENFFRIKFSDVGGIANDVGIGQPDGNSLGFNVNPNGFVAFNRGSSGEAVRIDSSGNLLVGKTSSDSALDGIELRASNEINATKTNGTPLYLRRDGSDGSFIGFNKDGSPVGSIGSAFGNRLFVGDGDTAVRFAGDLDTIVPWNGTANALRDAAIDLGEATGRFKDLYLSGTAYSDNVLVGTSSTSISSSGSRFFSGGNASITSAGTPFEVNRLSNNGNIIELKKDGSPVGSIGTASGDIFIGGLDNNHAGIRFAANNKAVLPIQMSDGALDDNTTDLGQADARFKDIYLSGTAYSDNVLVGTSNNPLSAKVAIEGTNTIPLSIDTTTDATYLPLYNATSTSTRITGLGAEDNKLFLYSDNEVAITCNADQKVGIGTISPTALLHVKKDTTASGVTPSSTTQLFLEGQYNAALQLGTTYTGQSTINFGIGAGPAGSAVAAKGQIAYNGYSGYLSFKTNSTERARITHGGQVIIGAPSSQNTTSDLVVDGDSNADTFSASNTGSRFYNSGSSGTAGINVISYNAYSTTPQKMMSFSSSYIVEFGSITISGNATSFNTSSDERLKENIKDAEDAGDKIDAIKIRQFDWKQGGQHQDYGVIAQELDEVAPEAVTKGATEDDMMSVDYSKLVPTLIKEIQSLRNRVAELEKN